MPQSLKRFLTNFNVVAIQNSLVKQIWYADDAAGAGPLRELRKWWLWWDMLNKMGTSSGYCSNAKKWLAIWMRASEKT